MHHGHRCFTHHRAQDHSLPAHPKHRPSRAEPLQHPASRRVQFSAAKGRKMPWRPRRGRWEETVWWSKGQKQEVNRPWRRQRAWREIFEAPWQHPSSGISSNNNCFAFLHCMRRATRIIGSITCNNGSSVSCASVNKTSNVRHSCDWRSFSFLRLPLCDILSHRRQQDLKNPPHQL